MTHSTYWLVVPSYFGAQQYTEYCHHSLLCDQSFPSSCCIAYLTHRSTILQQLKLQTRSLGFHISGTILFQYDITCNFIVNNEPNIRVPQKFILSAFDSLIIILPLPLRVITPFPSS